MASQEQLPANLGVRERKKRAVMEHVQSVALDLFDAHGFDAVTIEDIAAAAGVSPSTIYRHFGTKDRLVTHDELDRQLVAALLAAYPARGPLAAAREVLAQLAPVLAADKTIPRRIRYIMDEPAIWAAMSVELRDTADYLARQLVQASEQPVDPFDADVVAHLLCDTVLVAARIWREGDFTGDYEQIMARCLDVLESGLSLG